MTFIKPYLIRLSHCDPTGFVFYPNYFHIFNALVETGSTRRSRSRSMCC